VASDSGVAEGVDGILDGGEVCSGVIFSDEQGAFRTAFCGTLCLSLAFFVGVDGAFRGCVGGGQEGCGDESRF
jgi:hypothetical protein